MKHDGKCFFKACLNFSWRENKIEMAEAAIGGG